MYTDDIPESLKIREMRYNSVQYFCFLHFALS